MEQKNMNNKDQKLKNLAEIAAKNDRIPNDISNYIFTFLSKQELKIFLGFYKNALDKKRVYITTSGNLSTESLKSLKNIYKDKELIIEINPTLGAGIKIREKDMITDFTFKKYIDQTIDSLKD
jgi:F0F1-type ATP synthase delta subunit